MSDPYLTVNNLSVTFPTPSGQFVAVDDIGFTLRRGEILALVGESGSGKSMTSLAIMRLLPPLAGMRGAIEIDGTAIAGLYRRGMENVRGARIGMIFKEPMTSLNPVLRISRQMTEGLIRHRNLSRRDARAAAVAALDVTVQAQVLDLLVDLKTRHGSGILLITHDIGVVAETADRVAVMRGGRIVETGTVEDILTDPQHDYTKGLIASHLTVERAMRQRTANGRRGRTS